MEEDKFDIEAEKFFTDMKLPYDRKKIFVLGNILADFSLRGSVDSAVVNEAYKRVERISKIVNSTKN